MSETYFYTSNRGFVVDLDSSTSLAIIQNDSEGKNTIVLNKDEVKGLIHSFIELSKYMLDEVSTLKIQEEMGTINDVLNY